MALQISWKGKAFQVPCHELGPNYDYVTLGDLLRYVSERTQVPISYIKLLHSGDLLGGSSWWDWVSSSPIRWSKKEQGSWVIMKDVNARLIGYGIQAGSKIMMIGEKPRDPPPQHYQQSHHQPQFHQQQQSRQSPNTRTQSNSAQPTPSASTTTGLSAEMSMVFKLQEQIEYTQSVLMPMISEFKVFVNSIDPEANDGPPLPKPTKEDLESFQKKVSDEHAKISELLLQRLLKVDGVAVDSEFPDAKAKRKEAVKFIQGQLDITDGLRDRAKSIIQGRRERL